MASDPAALRATAVQHVLDGDAAEDVADAFGVSVRSRAALAVAVAGSGCGGVAALEYFWCHTKNYRLADFVPVDVPQADRTVIALLDEARHDQARLRSFFHGSPLPWDGVTGLF